MFKVEKSKILTKYNINESNLIGSGMEAEVYIYDKDKVLKLYNSISNFNKQEILKRFYDSIKSSNVSYELPYIYNIVKEGDIVVTIEKRIQGENMQSLLTRLNNQQLNNVMETYLSANLEMQTIKLDPKFEGYQLFNDYKIPVSQQKDWHHFLKQYLVKKQKELEGYLLKDVLNYQHKLRVLLEILSSEYQGNYSLIHGDFHPGNLIMNTEGKITGLIDFGLMTMCGDYLFDVATGWLFFDMYNQLKSNISERYLKLTLNTLGDEIKGRLYLYVLIYSIFSANFYSKDCNDGHYEWCVRNLNNKIYWENLPQIV